MSRIFHLISIIGLLYCFTTSCKAQKQLMNTVAKNDMTVNWQYQNDRIYFEMSAPTGGWVTIGFNTGSGMAGAYLLMGHIVNSHANVIEHYTSNPGNYQPINNYGIQSAIQDISGNEDSKRTTLKFSLPIQAASKYQKDLKKNMEYTMILAFSHEDDFQHHSMMRTSVKIKL